MELRDDDYERLASVLRKAIAWELLVMAREYDHDNEAKRIGDAIRACAHRVAAGPTSDRRDP